MQNHVCAAQIRGCRDAGCRDRTGLRLHLSARSEVRHQDVLSRKKGVGRAGFNSPSVLKTRKAQTWTPKTPSREGCAFYPPAALFPASTSKIPPYSLAREVQSSTLIVTSSINEEGSVWIFQVLLYLFVIQETPTVWSDRSADELLIYIITMNHNLCLNSFFPTIGRIVRQCCNSLHPTARQEIGAFKLYLLAE